MLKDKPLKLEALVGSPKAEDMSRMAEIGKDGLDIGPTGCSNIGRIQDAGKERKLST